MNCSIDRNNVKDLCSVPILYGIQHLDAKIKGTNTDYSVKIVGGREGGERVKKDEGGRGRERESKKASL